MRIALLDELKGLALINMIIYHVCYDLYAIYDVHMPWFRGTAANLWQEYICISFILISGIAAKYSKNLYRRAGIVIVCALLISLSTYIAMPEQIVVFGILHCIGISMLVVAILKPLLTRIPNMVGLITSIAIAIITRDLLVDPPFYSSDYFPLLPYIFVFTAGFYLSDYVKKLPDSIKRVHIRPLAFIGRHTLLIYMIHQPIIMLILLLIY